MVCTPLQAQHIDPVQQELFRLIEVSRAGVKFALEHDIGHEPLASLRENQCLAKNGLFQNL